MKQCHTKGRENFRELCVLPPLLGERAGVRASVSSNPIFGVGGSFFQRRIRNAECGMRSAPRYLGDYHHALLRRFPSPLTLLGEREQPPPRRVFCATLD